MPAIFSVVFSLFGKVFGWIVRPPVIYIVAVVVAAMFAHHWYAGKIAEATKAGYAQGYEQGALTGYKTGYDKGEKDEAQVYETKLTAERARAFSIVADERIQQQSIVNDLNAKLAAAEKAGDEARQLAAQQVKIYVTEKADAACTVPAGFVFDYNLSLAADPVGFSDGKPENVDAPSGIALSHVAAVAAANNAECVVRGEVIDAWQTWYAKNKTLYEETLKKQRVTLTPSPAPTP